MHNYFEELLIKYHDGICTEEEREIIKQHLKSCDECKKALMEMDFEIFYEPEKEQNKHLPITKTDMDSIKKEKADAGEEKEIKNNKKKANKFIRFIKAAAVGSIVLVLICVIYFSVSNNTLSDISKEYMEFYSDSSVLPEGIISDSGIANIIKLKQYKQEVYNQMLDYYIEENENFQMCYDSLCVYLSLQADGEENFSEIDIDEVEVAEIGINRATTYVYVGNRLENTKFEIKYRRNGVKWKIESVNRG